MARAGARASELLCSIGLARHIHTSSGLLPAAAAFSFFGFLAPAALGVGAVLGAGADVAASTFGAGGCDAIVGSEK